MDSNQLIPSENAHDRSRSTKDVDLVTTNEFFWNIDEVGEEIVEPEDECQVVMMKPKESSYNVKTPRYNSNFTGFLTEKEFSIETGKHIKNDCAPKKSCFNCLGDHNIGECTKKKDFQAIARNKLAILGKKVSNVRYHEDGENKFNFKAGMLSENLQAALGLQESQAPDFIYRMRLLGYPPGWLKEAEVKRSTVSLIDGSGKYISHPDDEEGETDMRTTKYQPEKFISFPGFNVPFPDHIKDESNKLNYPSMQHHHLKKNFLKFMKLNKADLSKRKKKEDPSFSDPPTQRVPGDMDVDDTAANESVIEVNDPPPTSPGKQGREDGELSDSNDCNNSESESNSQEPPELSKEMSPSLKRNLESESSDSSSTPVSKVKRHHRSTSKGFTLGVCIPESITPFNELPEATKWSVNVSDHILFDNLPDALGTWQKMRGIVKTVQDKLQKLNNET